MNKNFDEELYLLYCSQIQTLKYLIEVIENIEDFIKKDNIVHPEFRIRWQEENKDKFKRRMKINGVGDAFSLDEIVYIVVDGYPCKTIVLDLYNDRPTNMILLLSMSKENTYERSINIVFKSINECINFMMDELEKLKD